MDYLGVFGKVTRGSKQGPCLPRYENTSSNESEKGGKQGAQGTKRRLRMMNIFRCLMDGVTTMRIVTKVRVRAAASRAGGGGVHKRPAARVTKKPAGNRVTKKPAGKTKAHEFGEACDAAGLQAASRSRERCVMLYIYICRHVFYIFPRLRSCRSKC